MFLHQLPDAQALFEVVAKEKGFLPAIVEKDYRARMEAAAEQAASVQARGRRQDFLQRAIANAKKIYDAPSSHCGGVCAIAHLAETGRPRSKKTCPAF